MLGDLINYVHEHTDRGECQCGKCLDKGADRDAPPHSVDCGFFWVSARNDPTADALNKLLLENYPSPDRLKEGTSFIEIGGELGDQGTAILLLGLGELTGLWKIATPKLFGLQGDEAQRLIGRGFLYNTGWKQ